MAGIRVTQEDYERLLNKNKHLKVSGRSAGRSAKASSPAASKAKPVASSSIFSESAHAKALTQLRKNPALLKGNEEHYIQVELFYWLETEHAHLYDRTHAVPNSGKRGKLTAFKMQAEGQKKGVLDIAMDWPRGRYHGLRLELKTEIGRPSESQDKKALQLRADGYCAVFAYGLAAAKQAILEYAAIESADVELQHEYR